ncbi:TPA: hypothetical protein N0F65_005822 [Lagenidium giganteum]|uniref:Uncharacterized protein n=1 Tax=Lagenidium giganteum TaxID=4803 RepID=A0AAV2YTE9_9STRA|nr:TPA: hypothetical protein N0F65_005822 [Lagenidium giganteum]
MALMDGDLTSAGQTDPAKMTELQSLVTAPTTCRVSSVLDRNKALYGGDNMLSTDVNTCWNSAQGSPQQILLQFQRVVDVQELVVMFQGGFVGMDVECFVRTAATGEWTKALEAFDPEDSNDLQHFACVTNGVDALRLSFNRSSDFYGRVIIYRLDVLGSNAAAA